MKDGLIYSFTFNKNFESHGRRLQNNLKIQPFLRCFLTECTLKKMFFDIDKIRQTALLTNHEKTWYNQFIQSGCTRWKFFYFPNLLIVEKSRSLKLIISGNGWFFIWIIKLPSPDNISGKGGSSFFEMEHDYQWLIHKVKLFAFETIWWRRGVQ